VLLPQQHLLEGSQENSSVVQDTAAGFDGGSGNFANTGNRVMEEEHWHCDGQIGRVYGREDLHGRERVPSSLKEPILDTNHRLYYLQSLRKDAPDLTLQFCTRFQLGSVISGIYLQEYSVQCCGRIP
jgi:hypothetical protein